MVCEESHTILISAKVFVAFIVRSTLPNITNKRRTYLYVYIRTVVSFIHHQIIHSSFHFDELHNNYVTGKNLSESLQRISLKCLLNYVNYKKGICQPLWGLPELNDE